MKWRAKVAAKLVLSQLPVPYSVWRTLTLFKHGRMQDGSYAIGVFKRHVSAAGFTPSRGFVALELGPGDSVASAPIAWAHGAGAVYLVDVASHADRRAASYEDVLRRLQSMGLRVPALDPAWSVDELLSACGASYLTDGLASLRAIPDASIDFIWSHAVLEHVLRSDFDFVIRELSRVLRYSGTMSHRVDLEDHLDHSLNHLRFPSRIWESPWFHSSGFYTNRLLANEIEAAFERAGLVFETTTELWDRLPVERTKLSRAYRNVPTALLRIKALNVVVRGRRR